jgi:hypothetical protein
MGFLNGVKAATKEEDVPFHKKIRVSTSTENKEAINETSLNEDLSILCFVQGLAIPLTCFNLISR